MAPEWLLLGIGRLIGRYLKFVRATTRFVRDPEDYMSALSSHMPMIVTGWHGKHFMFPIVRNPGHPVDALVSKSHDGAVSAGIMQEAGLGLIRGSGGRSRRKTIKKGGIRGFLEMKAALEDGRSIAQTADVPHFETGRCGKGVVTLAKLSGRPILPCAVVTRHVVWDNTLIPLPFGKGAFIFGNPIYVPRNAGPDQIEALRQEVEASLNEVNERANALISRRS